MMKLETPADFDFSRTAFSHGWYSLPPFSHDLERKEISLVLSVGKKVVVSSLRPVSSTINVTVDQDGLTSSDRSSVIAHLRSCFRLDEDFSEFHREARRYPGYRWIARTGSGRLLRAPTVFEDVVKMICTTNCTWALTTLMVRNLVGAFGKKGKGIVRAFPHPVDIAASSERFLRKEINSGYRSPYLLELAQRVATGKLDLESWRSSTLPTEELFKLVRSVKGVGPYAAGSVLKLLGRYDYLGLDSWVRGRYYELHKKGRKVKDSAIEKHYRPFGKWRGLFFWLEMTHHWHDDKFPSIAQASSET